MAKAVSICIDPDSKSLTCTRLTGRGYATEAGFEYPVSQSTEKWRTERRSTQPCSTEVGLLLHSLGRKVWLYLQCLAHLGTAMALQIPKFLLTAGPAAIAGALGLGWLAKSSVYTGKNLRRPRLHICCVHHVWLTTCAHWFSVCS